MLAEFLTALRKLADEARAPVVLVHPTLPQTKTLVALQGELKEYPRVPPDLRETVDGLQDFLTSVKGYGGQDPAKTFESRHVFVSPAQVVCCYGDGRFDRTTLKLRPTERWLRLVGLAAEDLTQQEAVRLIRMVLHGAGADALLASLRVLNFSRVKQSGGTVQHGRESLGRNIEASVQQAESIPEQFTATVPVFLNAGFRDLVANVRVAVHVDVDREKVRLVPLADECPSQLDTAVPQVASRLAQELVDTNEFPCALVTGLPR